jgi:hypothetical protein
VQIEIWQKAGDPVNHQQQVLECLNRRIRGTQVETLADYMDNGSAIWKALADEVARELGAELTIDDETTTFDFCH